MGTSEVEPVSGEAVKSVLTQARLAEPDMLFLEKYKGEYLLYSFGDTEVKAVELDTEMKANAYGVQYDLERLDDSEYQMFYRFECAPYKGMVRIHSVDGGERHDYYLKYEDGMPRCMTWTKEEGHLEDTVVAH